MTRCCSTGRAQGRCRQATRQTRKRPSLSLCSSFGLHQLQRAGALHPFPAAVLDQLLQVDRSFVDGRDHPEVLAHVVPLAHAVEVWACLDQREHLLVLGDRAKHLDRFQRKRLERLLRPVRIGRQLADAGATPGRRDVDALGTERVDLPLRRVRHRLVGPDLRQRLDAPAHVLRQLRKLLLQGALLLAAAGDRKSTRLNSSHLVISYAVFCLKKKKKNNIAFMLLKNKKKKQKSK